MNPKRQFIIFLTAVVGFVLILSLLFGRGPASKSTSKKKAETPKSFVLNDYADKNSEVRLIVEGPIIGDDKFRSIRFTINPNNRTAEVLQGYNGNVIKTTTLANNSSAYDIFIHALAKTGFGRSSASKFESEKGMCASGSRFIFEVYENNVRKSRTWTAGCAIGNSPAAGSTVNVLFAAQITDYEKFASGVWSSY